MPSNIPPAPGDPPRTPGSCGRLLVDETLLRLSLLTCANVAGTPMIIAAATNAIRASTHTPLLLLRSNSSMTLPFPSDRDREAISEIELQSRDLGGSLASNGRAGQA